MQIKGEDFLKKVQLQQEKEELERKLTELDESRVSINNINLGNHLNNAYKNEEDINSINLNVNRNSVNNQFEDEPQEFDNIMLENPTFGNNGEDNKKKYLILGILLVVLFLLTIIIIRLLTSDSKKEDQFTTNNSSSEMRTLSENSNAIDANYQKIVDTNKERSSANEQQPMIPLQNNTSSTDTKLNTIAETNQTQNTPSINETYQAEAKNSISNEEMDQTIKKIEEKKATKKEVVEKAKTEPKKSIKDLVEGNSTSSTAQNFSSGTNGYFVQIGAFSKKPSENYLNNITKQGFKYKIIQEEVKGTMYNKLLIGPYASNSTASSSVSTIKEKLNITSAFVVKY